MGMRKELGKEFVPRVQKMDNYTCFRVHCFGGP